MYIFPLAVLDDLDLKGLFVAQRKDAGGNIGQLRDLRRTVTTCASDDFESLFLRPDRDGLNESVDGDALGKLDQLGWLEGSAWVGGGFVDEGKGDVAVL